MQSTSHCTKTLPLMPLANFSHFISLASYIILGVAQCEHTIRVPSYNDQFSLHFFTRCEQDPVYNTDSNTKSNLMSPKTLYDPQNIWHQKLPEIWLLNCNERIIFIGLKWSKVNTHQPDAVADPGFPRGRETTYYFGRFPPKTFQKKCFQ